MIPFLNSLRDLLEFLASQEDQGKEEREVVVIPFLNSLRDLLEFLASQEDQGKEEREVVVR